MSLPKVILFDRANGVDRSHIRLDTENLQTQTGSLLNHLVCVIRVLRRHGIRLPLDITGNVLSDELVTGLVPVWIGCPYLSRNENGQRARQSKDTGWLYGGDDGIDLAILIVSTAFTETELRAGAQSLIFNTYRLSSERLPDDRAVLDGVFRISTGRNHPPLTNVDHVHHANHEVITRTPAFLLLVESGDQVVAHIRSEVGRVQ